MDDALVSKLRKLLGLEALEGRSSLRLRLEPGSRVDVEEAVADVEVAAADAEDKQIIRRENK